MRCLDWSWRLRLGPLEWGLGIRRTTALAGWLFRAIHLLQSRRASVRRRGELDGEAEPMVRTNVDVIKVRGYAITFEQSGHFFANVVLVITDKK